MDTPIRIDRDKLFEEIWAEPMLKVTKRYGISDVGLAKACRRMLVPVPPRGYWARSAAGQKITKPALPPKPAGAPQALELSPTGPTVATETAARARRAAVESTNKILLEEILNKAHPFVAAAKKTLTDSQPDQYGRSTTRNGELDIRVSPALIPRALLIMNALVKAFDREGYKLTFKEGYGLGSFVLIEGQSVQFALDEAMERFERPPVPGKRPWSSYERFQYRSTGKLRFRIEKDITATDQKGFPLEKQLDVIFSTLQQTGIKLRERHEEWERQRRLSEQEARERQQAENQQRKLFEDLESWLKAEQLRRLITKTSELLVTQQTDVGYAERWLKWAEGHAASLDPFSQGLDKFFKHYQTDSWSTSRRWH